MLANLAGFLLLVKGVKEPALLLKVLVSVVNQI